MTSAFIDHLPTEVLSEIFNYLDHEDLKSSCLVSTRWNDIISESQNFLNGTKIVIDVDEVDLKCQLSRDYHDMAIFTRGNFKLERKILVQLSASCESLKYLEICVEMSIDKKSLLEFLECCPVLETLILERDFNVVYDPDIQSSISDVQNYLKLPKLKKLTLKTFDWILSHMKIESLDSLEITRLPDEDVTSEDHINRFLNCLNHLDKLSLTRIYLESGVELKPKFRWRYLKVKDIDLPHQSYCYKNWEILCSSSIEDAKVSIRYPTNLPFAINFLERCKNLKELKFDINNFPYKNLDPNDIDQIFINMRPNNVVKILKLHQFDRIQFSASPMYDESIFFGSLNSFVYRLRNVQQLELCKEAVNINGDFSIYHNIKHLRLERFMKGILNRNNFPILESLELEFMTYSDFKYLYQLGSTHEKLTYVKVRLIDSFRFYGEVTFFNLYICLSHVEKIEIVESRTNKSHVKTKNEIEMAKFMKVLSTEVRLQVREKLLENALKNQDDSDSDE